MTIIPGDIVIVKDLIFREGNIDKSINGRPCLVLYSNSETATVFPLTSRIYKYSYSDDYIFYDFGDKLVLVEMMVPYVVKRENIIYPLRNIYKDYFRIISKFQQTHFNSNIKSIRTCCEKLSAYSDIEEILKPILKNRYVELKEKSRSLADEKRDLEVEDVIEKRLIRKQHAYYKRNKEFDRVVF